MNKKKTTQKNSIIKIIISITTLIAINIISANIFLQIDMTAEKRHTITEYSKKTLKNIDGQIFITIYLEGKDLPLQFKKFRKSIIEELEIFKTYAGNNINYRFVNPIDKNMSQNEINTLQKELLKLKITRIENTQIKTGQATKTIIYPAATITYTHYNKKNDSISSRKIGLNLLNNDPNYQQASPENINNSIQTLEYKFINEITKITQKKRPTIVFLEGHGELNEPQVIDIERTLFEHYNVLRGQIKGRYGILDSIDALIIAKPTKKFSDNDKFVIDQYIMKGGKILWLIDGINVSMDSIYYYEKAFAMPANTEILKIDDQLFTYGVRINSNIIQDLICSPIMLKGNTQNQNFWYKWLYFPLIITQNNNVINKYINTLKTNFVSSIDTVGKNQQIKKTILLTSSSTSRKIKVNFPIEINFKEINQQPNEKLFNTKNIPIAILLEGQFPSLWKGRTTNKYLKNPENFIEKSKNTKMIIVADGDIIKNVVKSNGETMPLSFDKFSLQQFEGNKQFITNAINYLIDNNGLMSVKSKEFKLRLLNNQEIKQNKTKWKIINLLTPIFTIIIFGIIFTYIRKKKYNSQK